MNAVVRALALGVVALTAMLSAAPTWPAPPAPEAKPLNRDWPTRNRLLGLDENLDAAMGGVQHFDQVSLDVLEELFRLEFIDPDERQNESPPTKAFLAFLRKHPQVYAFGYAVVPSRDDYRVSLEGIWAPPEAFSRQLRKDFLEFCRGADEIDAGPRLYCWWD